MTSRTKSISCVIKVHMPEAYSLSEPQLEGFYDMFNRIIKVMPAGYIMHKQDYYTEEQYQRDESAQNFLSKAYEDKFHGRTYLNHECYLIITRPSHPDKFGNNLLSTFITGRLIEDELKDGTALTEFKNAIQKILHLIESSKLKTKLLNSKEVSRLLNVYFNLGESNILKSLQFEKDKIIIGDEELVFYNTINSDIELQSELNSQMNVDEFFDRSFTYAIGIGFKVPHIVNTIIKKNDTVKMMQDLSRKRDKILSMTFRSKGNANLVKEYDAAMEDQIKNGLLPVNISQNIVLWGKGEKLSKAENQLNNALTKLDVFVQRNINCGNVFWGCVPGNVSDIPSSEYQIQFTDSIKYYIPIETNPKSLSKSGINLSERDFGSPVKFDFWDGPQKSGRINNRNMFVLGPSGSGKSFFTNFMVDQLLDQDYHVTIIDVGGSYKRLCNLKKGKYFEYSQENKMSFNPFYAKSFADKTLEEQESLKTLVFTLWKGEKAEPKQEEYTILSKMLESYFKYITKREKTSNFNAYYEYVRDVFSKTITEAHQQYFDITSFLLVLNKFYEGGEYDYLLNSEDDFSISDLQFCVFELDEIKDHAIIFPVVALMIMEAFISKMRKHKKVKKIILIEEAWKALSNGGMAKFLVYLYKTVRKFNGAVGVITQEIEDIVGNKLVKDTIINNADIQILLDQSKYMNKFDTIQNLLSLPDSEKKKVLSINKMPRQGERFKDVYIRLGAFGQVFSVLVSRAQALVFTTEASESVVIDAEIADAEGDIEIGVRRLLAKAS